LKIIMDCVEAIKHCEDQEINVANFIVPTLLCQIDGLMYDYLMFIGYSWDNQTRGWIDNGTKNLVTNPQGRKTNREEIIKQQKPQILPAPLDELATQILLDILFSKAYPGESPASNLQFNRHKIVHGENKHYGRRDYMIRLFLVLDFLSHFVTS